jgi:hypothetical protein
MKISVCGFLLLCVMMTGCSSNPKYNYLVDPTPLQESASTYSLDSVSVKLILGHGGNADDPQFVTQEVMREQFEAALRQSLDERGILAEEGEADAALKVHVGYERRYNIGGKALNKPNVGHRVSAFDAEGNELANFGYGGYTVKYGIAQNVKISTFLWKAEGELADIQKVANIIASDISEMGQ